MHFAENGHLEVLKYLREEVKAPWSENCSHLHILEYLVDRKYDEYDEEACEIAAMNGHLDCLKYLHETAKAPWDEEAIRSAHENNHPECVNTFSTTTVRYQTIGDTYAERSFISRV